MKRGSERKRERERERERGRGRERERVGEREKETDRERERERERERKRQTERERERERERCRRTARHPGETDSIDICYLKQHCQSRKKAEDKEFEIMSLPSLQNEAAIVRDKTFRTTDPSSVTTVTTGVGGE